MQLPLQLGQAPAHWSDPHQSPQLSAHSPPRSRPTAPEGNTMPEPAASSADLNNLHEQYEALSRRSSRELTADESRGIDYYLADRGLRQVTDSAVRRWVTFVHDLEAFVADEGRMPRPSGDRPRPRSVEQSLVDRVAYQRRPAVIAAMTDYQRRRLECVPGFEWAPRRDRWMQHLADHEAFWATNGRPPQRRATDPVEAALGRWSAQQRAMSRAGKLTPRRAKLLEAARYRVL